MSLRRLASRIAASFRRGRLDRDLDAEVEAHLDLSVDEHIRRGLTAEEARAAARRDFGGVEQMKERYRDGRGLPMLDWLRQDVSYGWRVLVKTPTVTAVATISLALAMGANASVFSVINALMLRLLPVHDPRSLVILAARHHNEATIMSFPMYVDLKQAQQVLTDIVATAGETPVRLTIPATDGTSTELDNMRVSFLTGNYFDVLGVQPALGRFFVPAEDQHPQSAETLGSVIVLSDSFWSRQFGRNPQVLGRTILVGRSPCKVIGVAAAGFTGEAVGYSPVGWVPLVTFTSKAQLDERTGMFTSFIGRLKSGVTREQAEASLTSLFQQLLAAERRVRDDIGGYTLALQPGATGLEYEVRRTYARPLIIIMAMVATVLLIACTNIANLLLARAAARRGEIGIRLAIGCSRARLVGQLLTESVLLSLLGTIAGLLVAYWGSRALLQLISFGPVPITLDVAPDGRVIACVAAAGILAGIAFGLLPAWRATQLEVTPALKTAASMGSAKRSRHRLSRALVAGQLALSLLLLVGAGLLIRTLQNLNGIDWGFRPEHVVIFSLAHNAQHREPEAMSQAAWNVYARVKQVAGVDSVSLSGLLIFSPSDVGTPMLVPGYVPRPGERVFARSNSVSPGYFDTVGMTILEGRGIEERDTFTAPLAIVVNESFVRRYLGGAAAVGRAIKMGRDGKTAEIVGVVRDAKYNSLRQPTEPMFYVSIMQQPRSLRALEVRTRQPISAIAGLVRDAVRSANGDVMIRGIVSLTDQVNQSLAAERLMMRLASALGALALLLACVGLYGVMSYAVTQRAGEIGIRMALGATQPSVVWMALRQTLTVVALGLATGIPLALIAARLISGFLYGLTSRDPATLTIAAVVLFGSAMLAAYVPARRAASVDPVIALRHE